MDTELYSYVIIPSENMGNNIDKHSLIEALNNQKVVNFVRAVIKNNYKQYFLDHEREAQKIVDDIFELLLENFKIDFNDEKFKKIILKINQDILKRNNTHFWFNQIYKHYKEVISPQRDINIIEKYIVGNNILDFGCGGSYFSLALKNRGYNIFTTDILDYRIKKAQAIPFERMPTSTEIPFPKILFDTTIIKTVLHHINKEYIQTIINKLKNKTKRLLIKEDIIKISSDLEGFHEIRMQPQLQQFISLEEKSQFLAFVLFDFFGTIIIQGIKDINLPFQFKTITEWKRIIKKGGFKIVKLFLSAFELSKLHESCQVWIICDSN